MLHRSHHRSRLADDPTSSHRNRSRSPHTTHHHKRKRSPTPPPTVLPFQAQRLTKHDFATYKSMFALYLDIQKQLVFEDLEKDEVKGRWKSFVGKCNGTDRTEADIWRNRGELAEGWYDPSTRQKAMQSSRETEHRPKSAGRQRRPSPPSRHEKDPRRDGESSEDDLVGPALPSREAQSRGSQAARAGPAIPNMQDLELQRELADDDARAARDDMRHARKLDRTSQKAALDELVPRAEAGTRERQLEKKREKTETMRAFGRAKSPGAVEEVGEGELMGDEEGGVEGYKKVRKEVERKKNEREVRKEEMLRARAAEREERVREYQVKEDRTMAMLRTLAEQRFG